ncbi:MAG TPA: sigma-70 factor domain-containing protein, partial [Streptosporangiaceae bacterium]|nr:sigma-70 factor domain-containing protein [Streptosporangiaceae bacterium]
MPRTATALAAREDEETTTHVDELIQRGRGQGYLSLPELRDAFDQARVSPTEARSIIRELTEAGVVLGNERADGAGAAPDAAVSTARDAEFADAEMAAMAQPQAQAQASQPADDASTSVPETDLDDQTSVMGDSVHTYLKSIGRRQLLTAEEEVDLAKRIEAGLYAEHKLETERRLSKQLRVDLEAVAEDGRRAKAHML